MKERVAVCLLSGGLDSCVAATWAKREGCELYLLSVNYGQVMRKELDHARRIAEILCPLEHKVLTIERFNEISRSSRTDAALIEYDRPIKMNAIDVSAAYPPGRDPSFIFMAAAWLESIMLDDVGRVESGVIVMGTNKNDAMMFPDCRPEIYGMVNEILNASTKISFQFGKRIAVMTPLIERTKDQVVQLGIELDAPLHLTWSCYEGKETACGRCDPCKLRLWAFDQIGRVDPTSYRAREVIESIGE